MAQYAGLDEFAETASLQHARFSVQGMARLLDVSTPRYCMHVTRVAATVLTPRQLRRPTWR